GGAGECLQPPGEHRGGIDRVVPCGVGGAVQRGHGVLTLDGQQGQMAAQHGPRLRLGQAMCQVVRGGVDAGECRCAGDVFGPGGERVGVHQRGAVQAGCRGGFGGLGGGGGPLGGGGGGGWRGGGGLRWGGGGGRGDVG